MRVMNKHNIIQCKRINFFLITKRHAETKLYIYIYINIYILLFYAFIFNKLWYK